MEVVRAIVRIGVICCIAVAIPVSPAWAQGGKKNPCTFGGEPTTAIATQQAPRSLSRSSLFAPAQTPAPSASSSLSVPAALTTDDTRMVVGFSASTASGLSQSFAFLLDFYLTAPFGPRVTQQCKPGVGVWLNARFTGQSQNLSPSIKQFVGGFEDTVVGGNLVDVVQVADVLLGLEFKTVNGFNFGRHYQIQPLIFAGLGFISPPPHSAPPPVFALPDNPAKEAGKDQVLNETRKELLGAEAAANNDLKYIGFVLPDAHAFDRQWYAGIRLKSHHFRDCTGQTTPCSPDDRENFPGIIDLGAGQNSAVTGGSLGKASWVFRLDMFYPLPADNVANAIYLFGSAAIHVQRPPSEGSIFLAPPNAVVPIPSPGLFLRELTVDERTRDSWQVGVGVDLARVFKRARDANDARATIPGTGVDSNADVRIQRLSWKAGESLSVASDLDVLVPLKTGTLLSKLNGALPTPLSLTAGSALALDAGIRKLDATGDMEAYLIRPLTPASNPPTPTTFALADASKGELKQTYETGQFTVHEVTLKATGKLTATLQGRTMVLVPGSDLKIKIGDKETDAKAQKTVLVNKGSVIEIVNPAGAAADLRFLLVTLK